MEKLGPRVRVRSVQPLRGFTALIPLRMVSKEEINLSRISPVPFSNRSATIEHVFLNENEGGTIAWDKERILIRMFSITISGLLGWKMLKRFRRKA